MNGFLGGFMVLCEYRLSPNHSIFEATIGHMPQIVGMSPIPSLTATTMIK